MKPLTTTALVFAMAILILLAYLGALALLVSATFGIGWFQSFVGLFVAYSLLSQTRPKTN